MSLPLQSRSCIPAFLTAEELPVRVTLFPSMSPVRIRAMAHLYDVETVPLEAARVLEIDCGIGSNLFPYAAAYPNSTVVGICMTHEECVAGQNLAADLGLSNLTLVTADLSDIESNFGKFDYVISSWLYSKLSTDNASGLLALSESLLSQMGIACVGYETNPGSKLVETVRDAMLMHIHGYSDADTLSAKAQAALSLFNEGLASANPQGIALSQAAKQVALQIRHNGVHAVLGGEGSPCYFIEFADRANRANLSCVGDIQPLRDLPEQWGDNVSLVNSVVGLGQQAALRAQYLDFVTNRTLRHTLLVKTERHIALRTIPNVDRFVDLGWAGGWQRESLGPADNNGVASFINHQGRRWQTSDLLQTAVLDVLETAWPQSIAFALLEKNVKHICEGYFKPAESWTKSLISSLQTLLAAEVLQCCLGNDPYAVVKEQDPLASSALVLAYHQKKKQPQEALGSEIGHQALSWFPSNLWAEPFVEPDSELDIRYLERLSSDIKKISDDLGEKSSQSGQMIGNALGVKFRTEDDIYADIFTRAKFLGIGVLTAVKSQRFLIQRLKATRGIGGYWALYLASKVVAGCAKQLPTSDIADDTTLTPQQKAQIQRVNELVKRAAYADAEALSIKLLERMPGCIDLHLSLATCYSEMGRAADAFSELLWVVANDKMPEKFPDALVLALNVCKRYSLAIAVGRLAVLLKPRNPYLYNFLGLSCMHLGKLNESERYFARCLELAPDNLSSRLNYLSVLGKQGKVVEGVAKAREALDSNFGRDRPAYRAALYHNLLFLSNYDPDRSAEEIFSDYQSFEKEVCKPLYSEWRSHKNRKNLNRRLRIGYISPDFRNHAVARFIEPVFSMHDRAKFEIFAYSDVKFEDGATEQFKSLSDRWISVVGESDASLASRIRTDQIDILVDLAGHTANNRLGVFARKPAPVSVSWLGYGYTTGMTAIDYFLGDNYFTPPGCEHLFAEKIWRLPRAPYVYKPHNLPLDEYVTPLPAKKNDFLTLVSLSRSIRINDRVIKVWAEIMRKIPTARLVINSENYLDARVCSDFRAKFKSYGIDSKRIFLGYSSPPWQTLRESDIGLDCFPHNAGTTLMDMLCFGVPYVTLSDRPSVGRIGSSNLTHAGFPQFISNSEEEYIAKVFKLAEDFDALSELRVLIHKKIRESALLQPTQFVQDLEEAYISMFDQWVKSSQ